MAGERKSAAVVGGGPAGLMAAETLSAAGIAVTVYEAMPTIGRKFLMAGRGGLNITHSEPLDRFVEAYGPERDRFAAYLDAYTPQDMRDWAAGLGSETFVGTSGRVFPVELKASTLLRAWLRRLAGQGVAVRTRHRWHGFAPDGGLVIRPEGADAFIHRPDATILALGGASWPRLGSDGAWAPLLAGEGHPVAPFKPANCGFEVAWTPHLVERFDGAALKNLALSFEGRTARGELLITRYGLEGGPLYALSRFLRDAIDRDGAAVLHIDLKPDLLPAAVAARLAKPRGGASLANWLRRALALPPPAIALLREAVAAEALARPDRLAAAVKALPLRLAAYRGLDRAISSAGGLSFAAVDESLMLRGRPGVFAAGEMLDWEAPTGGYLLQGCFATGLRAARGALAHLGA